MVGRLPQRTCLGCRQVKSKRDLVRLVRTGSGAVEIDPPGKSPGRGAYLCREQGCWDEGLLKKRLDYALRTKMTPDAIRLLSQSGPRWWTGQEVGT